MYAIIVLLLVVYNSNRIFFNSIIDVFIRKLILFICYNGNWDHLSCCKKLILLLKLRLIKTLYFYCYESS